MLDTDALLLKSLIPPRLKPPPWLRMQVNPRHPLTQGLQFFHNFSRGSSAPPMLNTGAPNLGNPGSRYNGKTGPVGITMGSDGVGVGYTGTFPLNPAAGTMIFHVGAQHASNSGFNGWLFGANLGAFPGASGTPGFGINRDTSNRLVVGWWDGTDKRLFQAFPASAYAAGQSFTLGCRWSGSNRQDAIHKGLQIGTSSTSFTTSSVSTADTRLGYFSGTDGWDTTTGGHIYAMYWWNRYLPDHELLQLEHEPYCFLEPEMPALWFQPALVADFVHRPRFLAHLRR